MSDAIRWEMHDGVAVITLDAPQEKVNLLDAGLLDALERTAQRLAAEKPTAAVVMSAKKGGFIAGADIRQIEAVADAARGAELARRGQEVFGLWAALPFPVVAAIHGHCLGGGTEFALACHFRIAAPDAAIGLPEVKLGILPGFGGSQRLPRLITIEKALDLILTGRSVTAGEALAIGLVDRLAPPEGLLDEALVLAREAALDARHLLAARRRHKGGWRRWLLEGNPLGRAVVFRGARERIRRQTRGHYPAPLRAIEVIEQGLRVALTEGLRIEARALGELCVTTECKNLIHVFLLSQRPKRGPGVAAAHGEVRRAAVIGAGVMGGGIAWLLAARGIPVLLKDIRAEAVQGGLGHARDLFRRHLSRKVEKEELEAAVEAKMALIAGATTYEGFAGVDLAIEAVVEKMAVKQAVLREAEAVLPEGALFATNTSALSVTALQSAAQRPQNVGGLHFFNPVDRMPLVEVIRGEQTSDETVATLYALAQRLGKTPIVAADRPGFLVNRLLVAYLNEACLLAGAGVDWQALDRRALAFGWPMGPFRLIDEVGIDIAAEVGRTLCAAFSRLPESPLLGRAAASGLLGRKGGAGFYLYAEGKQTGPNPQLGALLGLRGGRPQTEDDWRRLLLLMVNEAGRCLEEGVVGEAADVDTGMVFGAGFPPFRGGLCRWADREGLAKLVGELAGLAGRHGERFAPCAYLRGWERFYA